MLYCGAVNKGSCVQLKSAVPEEFTTALILFMAVGILFENAVTHFSREVLFAPPK